MTTTKHLGLQWLGYTYCQALHIGTSKDREILGKWYLQDTSLIVCTYIQTVNLPVMN